MKKITFSVLMLTVIIGGCSMNKDDKTKLDELTTLMNLEEQNITVVKQYLNGLNKNDTAIYEDLYAQVYSPDCKVYAPAGNTIFLNYTENIKSQKAVYVGIPDAHWKIVDIAADGNTVFVRLWTTGTSTGIYNGLQPTGKKLEFSNTVTFKLENGKIKEQREDFDQLSLMQQYGFELKPPVK